MLLLSLLACGASEPAFVFLDDVERAAGRGETHVVCAGLRMEDAEVRARAAELVKDNKLDAPCACEPGHWTQGGRWDPVVLEALRGADQPSLACLGDALKDTALADRPGLAALLARVPAARAGMVAAAKSDPDPAVRAAAMAAMRGTKDAAERAWLLDTLAHDAAPQVRAGAAAALVAQADAAAGLAGAVTGDSSPEVRGAAIASLAQVGGAAQLDAAACAALSDAAPEVRLRAAESLRATRNAAQLACLGARLAGEEPDARVRAAVLAAVAASPAPEAAAALCDAVLPWTRAVVKDAPPPAELDIARAQNNRDPEGSFACFQRAAAQVGGLPCAARAYVLGWFHDVGGGVVAPNCKGGPAPAPQEIVFGAGDFGPKAGTPTETPAVQELSFE
jgi:hypothetical protein